MSFDCSRFTFDPWRDFQGVIMQQGRVQLDADWNELVAQFARRIQAGTFDTFSKPVVPRVTPNGFKIELRAGQLQIGVGRLYVDGVLAENHGQGARRWDAKLAEQVGSVAFSYTDQPYYPAPPSLPRSVGPHLAYLDVWQREVTSLQQPELVEKAVGVDTGARLQTVWQVKVLPNVGEIDRSTPDADIPGWLSETSPSAGVLSTREGQPPEMKDPCEVPPTGGYKGRENQLYRVELHDEGVAGKATFKWSRENASVLTRVTKIDGTRTQLTVESTGRDEVLRFSDGDWVEITDDARELRGESGVMARILPANGVRDDARTITLETALADGAFPTDTQGIPLASRHTRIRRWEQKGKILRDDGSVYVDLNDASSQGVIPVPANGAWLFLEDGILVKLEISNAAGKFRRGDHWSFAARSADASIELLDKAPPRGIHHHYARLALLRFPDTETDLRELWPAEPVTGDDCACDVCVTAEEQLADPDALQKAVDRVARTGGIVCLGAGLFRLRRPLRIERARSVTVRGKGFATVLVPESAGPVVQIRGSVGITLERMALYGYLRGFEQPGLIYARNVADLTLDRLYVMGMLAGDYAEQSAVDLGGYTLGVRIQRCVVVAPGGVRVGRDREKLALVAQLAVEHNLLLCARDGVALTERAMLYGACRVADNLIVASRLGITALSGGIASSLLSVHDNQLLGCATALVAGATQVAVADNFIDAGLRDTSTGILLRYGMDPAGMDDVVIARNRILRTTGTAIEVTAPIVALRIRENLIKQVQAAVSFRGDAAAEHLVMDDNEIVDVATRDDRATGPLAAVEVMRARVVSFARNVIRNVAPLARTASQTTAVRMLLCQSVRVQSNHLSEIGPTTNADGPCAAIDIDLRGGDVLVTDNVVQRGASPEAPQAFWQALRVCLPESGAVRYVGALALGSGYLLTSAMVQRMLAVPARAVNIRGNQLRASAIMGRIVDAEASEALTLGDNQVFASSGTRVEVEALVALRGPVILASNNRLRWSRAQSEALALTVPDPNDKKQFSVSATGNVTRGPITLNGEPLPAPWQALNVLG